MQWYPVSVWELLFEVSLPVCICNIYTLPPFWKNNKNSVGRWSFPSDSWCHQKTINAQRNKGGHFTRQLSIKSNLNLFWKMSGGCLQSSACRCILRICWAHIFSHLCLVNFMKPWWDTTFFFFFSFCPTPRILIPERPKKLRGKVFSVKKKAFDSLRQGGVLCYWPPPGHTHRAWIREALETPFLQVPY